MRLPRAWLLAVLGAVAAIQVVALLHWATNFGPQVGEDFDVHWAAAHLLATGHRGTMFSLTAQLQAAHASGVALTYLYDAAWGPVGLATVLPLSLLPLPFAVGVWTALQAGALLAATVLAAGDRNLLRRQGALVAAALLAAPGLAALLALGQWEGFAALLVVLSWRDAAAGRRTRSTLWLLLLAAALPQMVLGLVVFQVGRWGWRPVRTLLAGGAAIAAAWALLLGPAALGTWLHQLLDLSHQPLRDTDGLAGAAAGIAGSGPVATAAGLLAALAALAACWVLARRDREGGGSTAVMPSVALTVTALSLLASPHVFDYYLVVLAPLVVAAVLTSAQRGVALLWAALGALTVAGLHAGEVWWRPLVPLLVLALAMPALPAARRLGYALRW